MPRTWTHADLVERAGQWLRNSAYTGLDRMGHPHVSRCSVVLTELHSCGIENPDAIGWRQYGHISILLECKASRQDFLVDKYKAVRRAGEKAGMGRYRFYMAPPGIIQVSDLKQTKWGLLEVKGRSVTMLRLSGEFEYFKDRERELFWSACRKYQRAEKAVREEMSR